MITRDAAHRYTDTETGITVPGVTSILDVIDKSFPLMTWAARQTATAAVALVENLPAMIAATGEEGTIKALTSRANWQRDEAAQLGTEVHALADKLVRGIPPPTTMTDTQKARVEHYAKWWEGELAGGSKMRLTEGMILRPASEFQPYGYGGTFDLLYFDADGKTVLADIKTGGKWGRKAYESEILQVTAYGMGKYVQPALDMPMVPTAIYPMPLVDKYKLIHVTGEGCKPIDVDVTVKEHMAWAACLDLYNWREGLKGKIR